MNRRALEAIGVTRVARITGLDRLGVEVACAIRPLGHVLQVSNGKGFTRGQASASAVAEAAELTAAEWIDPTRFLFASADEMAARFGERAIVTPDELPSPAPFWHRGFRCGWIEGVELLSRARIFVPATSAQCGTIGSALGPSVAEWTSNGMGAHPSREQAIQHALLEAIERHALAEAMPHGWTRAILRERSVAPSKKTGDLAAALERADRADLSAAFIDLTLRGLDIPVAGCVLVDELDEATPLTAGYAADFSPEDAMRGAFLEAAQSRLTDIHGAREDIVPGGASDARRMKTWLKGARPRAVKTRRGPASTRALTSALRRIGVDRIACVEWQLANWRVAKVLIPGFQRSELL